MTSAQSSTELIERFVDGTGGTFPCSDIVGRRFESVADHADFLRGGGCADIIDLVGTR